MRRVIALPLLVPPPVGSGNVTLHDYPLQSSYPHLGGESGYGNNMLEHANTVMCQLFSWSQAHMISHDKIRHHMTPYCYFERKKIEQHPRH